MNIVKSLAIAILTITLAIPTSGATIRDEKNKAALRRENEALRKELDSLRCEIEKYREELKRTDSLTNEILSSYEAEEETVCDSSAIE